MMREIEVLICAKQTAALYQLSALIKSSLERGPYGLFTAPPYFFLHDHKNYYGLRKTEPCILNTGK